MMCCTPRGTFTNNADLSWSRKTRIKASVTTWSDKRGSCNCDDHHREDEEHGDVFVLSVLSVVIGILLFDDVEELDFVGPLEVFGMAARHGADCRTALIAAEPKEIRCRYGMRVLPDFSFENGPTLDILIVPGGLGARTHARQNPRILD